MPRNIRYISKVGRDGWLRVRLNNDTEQSLPQLLKVSVSRGDDKREYFEILEGSLKGRQASVARPASGHGSYLMEGEFHTPATHVRFDRAKQMLWFGPHGPFNAFTGGFNNSCPGHAPVAAGIYQLQIPFAPSQETRPGYYAYTDFHKTWFRLGLSPYGDQFLHVGEISHGCVTVRPFIPMFNGQMPGGFEDLPGAASGPAKGCIGLPLPTTVAPTTSWTQLYSYLISARANDSSVGRITVL